MDVKVTINKVIVDSGYIVNKQEYKVNPLEFTFDSEYEGLVKKAIFVAGNIEIERAIIDDKCDIPYDVLDEKMFELRVYAYAVENDELVLRYSPTYAKIFLREGSYRGVTGSGEVITPTQFEQYESALNQGLQELAEGLAEVANVDIDVSKSGTTATVTITNREGTQKSVEIEDGTDYVITEEDYEGIADIVEERITPIIPTKTSDITNDSGFITNQVNNLVNYTLKSQTGSSVDLTINNDTYVMTLALKDVNGNVLSTKSVDLPLETMVVSARYDDLTKSIILVLKNGQEVSFSVADLVSGLVDETTFNTAMATKVDKVDGKGLSTEDYTTAEKNKLAGIDLTDYVKNTDYATDSKYGIIKTGNGLQLSGGNTYATTFTYQIYSGAGNGTFIGKGTLENVLTAKIGDINSLLDELNGTEV